MTDTAHNCKRLCLIINKTQNLYDILTVGLSLGYTAGDIAKMRIRYHKFLLPLLDGEHMHKFTELSAAADFGYCDLSSSTSISVVDFTDRLANDWALSDFLPGYTPSFVRQ